MLEIPEVAVEKSQGLQISEQISQKKKHGRRLIRIDTPKKMALWVERYLNELRNANLEIEVKAAESAKLFRILIEIHRQSDMGKKVMELEERLAAVIEALEEQRIQGRFLQ